MLPTPSRYTVTAALPYANGPVHIGHLAGCYLPADIYVRWLRLQKRDVAFICGSDEHGVAITIKAAKEGVSPQQLVDKYDGMIRQSFLDFGISTDVYSRTSSPRHHQVAADFFKTLYEKDVFIQKESTQYYDPIANQFLADRYIIGTCPNCGYDNAYGDQCENCGKSLDPQDLINPRSALSGEIPIMKNTKHWYLPLQKYENWLTEYILEQHNNWKPNVLGQCKSWLNQGLQERSITRDMSWGVQVPLPDAEGKVLYVWMDAPIGYISATQEWAENTDKNWEDYWMKDDTKLVHFIGKDNIVFHCIIFPVMLQAHGGYILPENVPANEFLNIEGDKVSTSRNHAVWLHEYLLDFPDMQDVLRYVLISILPETKDSDFTWKDFQQRNNSELADILGNLVNRIIILIHKFYNGKIPAPDVLTQQEIQLMQEMQDIPARVSALIDNFKIRDAQTEAMNLARLGNKYLTENEPWKSIKTDVTRTATVMHFGIQLLANLSIVLQPFLPFTCTKIQLALNLPDLTWADAGRVDLVPADTFIEQLPILFRKIEDTEIEIQAQKLAKAKLENLQAQKTKEVKLEEIMPSIAFDDFAKIDLRVGNIIAAERIPKADKLLNLTIDLGTDIRSILSGIAEYFKPEDIIGQQVVVVANLAPRKMRGIESQGMILMAEDNQGNLQFVLPATVINPGSTVR
ncbi:MAG: methionine--tRNA ligase [Bacteroidota bacterium]|nr:methionine--tRNA ligase [Bacteroidota bacterium]